MLYKISGLTKSGVQSPFLSLYERTLSCATGPKWVQFQLKKLNTFDEVEATTGGVLIPLTDFVDYILTYPEFKPVPYLPKGFGLGLPYRVQNVGRRPRRGVTGDS
jgi:hypothetical protein